MLVRYYTRKENEWTKKRVLTYISFHIFFLNKNSSSIRKTCRDKQMKTKKKVVGKPSQFHLYIRAVLAWNAAEIETLTVTHNIKLEKNTATQSREKLKFTEQDFFSFLTSSHGRVEVMLECLGKYFINVALMCWLARKKLLTCRFKHFFFFHLLLF